MKYDRWRESQSDGRNEFVAGTWNAIDDRSGHKVKANKLRKQWDGFRTVKPQKRHEQDFLRSRKEKIGTPWTRPRTDNFVNEFTTLRNGNFITDTDWTKGVSWSITNGFATYSGSTDTMYQDANAVNGKIYEVVFTIFDYSSGSLTASIGTASGTARSGNGTFTENITSSGANSARLTFTPATGAFKLDSVRILRVG